MTFAHRVIQKAAEKTVGGADVNREAGVRLLYMLCNRLEIYFIFWLVAWEAAHLRNPVTANKILCHFVIQLGVLVVSVLRDSVEQVSN